MSLIHFITFYHFGNHGNSSHYLLDKPSYCVHVCLYLRNLFSVKYGSRGVCLYDGGCSADEK